MLVTALESNDTVPSMDKVTEQLMHEEQTRDKETEHYNPGRKALTAGRTRSQLEKAANTLQAIWPFQA